MGLIKHSFSVDLAKIYGIEEAIILDNIAYWVYINKANENNYNDGKYWTYNSAKALSQIFIYMSEKKIQRLLARLEELGLIISGNYNKLSIDKTKWYALSDEMEQFYFGFRLDKNVQWRLDKNVQPIPNINNIIIDINNKTNLNNNINNNISCSFEKIFDTLWQLYPKKQGKGQVSDKTKRKIADIGVEEMTRAINRFVRQMDKEGRPKQYIMQGSTFFNSGYVDYLDCNYDAPEHATDLNKWFQILAKEYPNTENLGEAEKVFKSLFDNKQTEEEWKDYAFEILKAMRQYVAEYRNHHKTDKYIRSLDKFLANDLKYLLMEKDEE